MEKWEDNLGRTRALEQETWDFDMELKKMKMLKAIYGYIMAEGEINNLTMEQYLALNRGNQEPGVVKPEIRGNVNFKIKSQFMRELREDTFSGSKNSNAHEHVERILDIVSWFNILGVINDAVMLRIFPITLLEPLKGGWKDYP
ncbi:hypothetical protein Tco_0505281 [Tanacetum coccineum]